MKHQPLFSTRESTSQRQQLETRLNRIASLIASLPENAPQRLHLAWECDFIIETLNAMPSELN